MIINQLPSVPSAADADEIVVEIGTTTYKIKKSDFLKEFMKKSGGEFTGDVTVNGVLDVTKRRGEATLSAAGWYRAIVYNAYDTNSAQGASGEILTIKIVYTSGISVQHEISLFMTKDKVAFLNEVSRGTTNVVDKIRYTYAGSVGYVDIHIASSSSVTYNVSFEVASRNYAQGRWVAGTLTSVSPSPSGETVLAEYTFTTITGARIVHAQSSTSFGDAIATIKNIIGDNDITYGGNAANNLHAGISNFSNGVFSVNSSGGPYFFATLGKLNNSYYAAELFSYNYLWRIKIRNANGTYHAELYYPNY